MSENKDAVTGAEAKAPKLYRCAMCQMGHPKSNYSSKQFKKKGKRICKSCVVIKSTMAAEPQQSIPSEFDNKADGNQAVKNVNAAELAAAQLRYSNEQSPDTDKFDTMLKWLTDGGATFPHLLLKYYTVDYRGVHAKRRLGPGEVILCVPKPLLMTTDVAKESKIGLEIAEGIATKGLNISSHTWLASFLLQEKHNPTSFWKPYLDILPKHYRNMPVFFDDEELKWLKGSFTLQMISNRKLSLKMEYDQICACVPSYNQFHHLEFVWARLAVITRIFGFEIDGRKTDGLVAMADMLNHKRPNETTWNYDQGRGGFTITTTKRLLKGSQIFDSYGRKCNSRYFVNYGFSLDQNEDNQVAMWFDLPADDPPELRQAKAALIGTRQKRFQIPFDHKEKVTVEALAWLRVAHSSMDELKTIAQEAKTRDNPRDIPPVNARNEQAVMKALAEQAAQVLAGFDCSLEEDNRLLREEKSLTMNVRNCIVMRRGEKEVLQAYIDLGSALVDLDAQAQTYPTFRKWWQKNYKSKGREPDFDWRKDRWLEDIWVPFWTGERKKIEITNNQHEGD